jgi:hypothetical protein
MSSISDKIRQRDKRVVQVTIRYDNGLVRRLQGPEAAEWMDRTATAHSVLNTRGFARPVPYFHWVYYDACTRRPRQSIIFA